MSNRITITPTKFQDIRTGEVSFGFRAYDDYGQTYANTMESIPEDNLEFLKAVVEDYPEDRTLNAMLEQCVELEKGLEIGNEFYDYSDVAHILDA